MVKIQHTCDICKKVTDTNKVVTPVLVMAEQGLAISMQEIDVCQDCIMDVCPVEYQKGDFCIRPQSIPQDMPEDIKPTEAEPQMEYGNDSQVEDFDINDLKKGK